MDLQNPLPRMCRGRHKKANASETESTDSGVTGWGQGPTSLDSDGSEYGVSSKMVVNRKAFSPENLPKYKIEPNNSFSSQSTVAPKHPRLFIDGVFDLVHAGHFNAIRQAKSLTDCLVVGIDEEEAVRRVKGSAPLLRECERAEMIGGCKWVDEVVHNVPFRIETDLLDRHNCDYCAHGDDATIDQFGRDYYGQVKSAGRFITLKRTEGISTTALLDRLLFLADAEANESKSESSPQNTARENSQKSYENSHDQKTAKSHEKTSQSDEKTSENHEKIIPKNGEKIPKNDEKNPENDEKIPKNDEKFPKNDEQIPKNDEQIPKNDEQIPKNDEKIPKNDEKFPKNDEQIPKNDENIPKNDEKIPKNDENIPKNDEKIPKNEQTSQKNTKNNTKTPQNASKSAKNETPRKSILDGKKKNYEENTQTKTKAPKKQRTSNAYNDEKLCSITSTRRLFKFMLPVNSANANDKIVYVDGSYDIFHVGHVRTLRRAKQLGDYLIVGIHADHTVNQLKGAGYPVVGLTERALSVLAMKYVDEVVIGAPYEISPYFLRMFKIDIVVRGTEVDSILTNHTLPDPYTLVKELGIYQEIAAPGVTTSDIMERVRRHKSVLEGRIATKKLSEAEHWEKSTVSEIFVDEL